MLLAWLAFAIVAASGAFAQPVVESAAFATAVFVVGTFLVAEGTLGNDREKLQVVLAWVVLAWSDLAASVCSACVGPAFAGHVAFCLDGSKIQ